MQNFSSSIWRLTLSGLIFWAIPIHAMDHQCRISSEAVARARMNRREKSSHSERVSRAIWNSPLDTREMEKLMKDAIETGDPRPLAAAIERLIQEGKLSKELIDERLADVAWVERLGVEGKKSEDAGAVTAGTDENGVPYDGIKSLAYTARALRAVKAALQSTYPQKAPTITLHEAMKRALETGDFQELDLHVAEIKEGDVPESLKVIWLENLVRLEVAKLETRNKYDPAVRQKALLGAMRLGLLDIPIQFPPAVRFRTGATPSFNLRPDGGSMLPDGKILDRVEHSIDVKSGPHNPPPGVKTPYGHILEESWPASYGHAGYRVALGHQPDRPFKGDPQMNRLIFPNYSAGDYVEKLDQLIEQIQKKIK